MSPIPAPPSSGDGRAVLRALVERFPGLRVLVLGEAFLDGWLSGPSSRLSREAPVPVVGVTGTREDPGATANAAANAAALGARVRFLSVVGDDEDGDRLRGALRDRGVADADVLVAPDRRTVAKRRVVAGGQMLVRLDTGDTGPVDETTRDGLLARLAEAWDEADAVVVGDYDAGVLGPEVRSCVAELQARAPRPLVVDARRPRLWAGVGATALKPNADEVASLLDEADAERLRSATGRRTAVVAELAPTLLARAGTAVVAATLDVEGGVLLQQDRPPVRLPTQPAPHSRAAGAGDAFTAAFALALGLGAAPSDAGAVAAAAAACTLRTEGTSVCSAEELRRALSPDPGAAERILDLTELAEVVAAHRTAGRSLVVTNGAFDTLHRGHVSFLRAARELGDVLVVGLNSDEGLARSRGAPPEHSLEDRAAVLAALSVVDHLAVFDEDTADRLLEAVQPDVYVKGGDYTRAMLPEADLVESLGGVVRILDYSEDHRPALETST